MSPQEHVKVRPGDGCWDWYIQWLYDRENHGIEQIIHDQAEVGAIYRQRAEEADKGGMFMHITYDYREVRDRFDRDW